MKFRKLYLFVIAVAALVQPCLLSASQILEATDSGSDKPLVFPFKDCRITVDPNDFEVVKKTAGMLAQDLGALTGKIPGINTSSASAGGYEIIIGTLGQSAVIDSLAEAGAIPGESIRGGWERFIIKTITGPDNNRRLVIAGSDRRGTAYGVTTLSRCLGVNPWEWWADVPVGRRPNLGIKADYISQEPTIRYRGIFINDEDWGMYPWAAQGLDKDIKDIGPNTYAKVCELLLRLKANMLAPAMHSCTGAFYSHPDSKAVADSYGIIITTSHCEPMLFNNAAKSEWSRDRDGEWDYATNRDVIYNKFVDRLDEAAPYENIYTIGMRGVHDEAMSRHRPLEERIAILEQVITDQRDLLSRKFGKPADEIPQIFVPYKETLELYRNGLRVPDDVTIVWPDDNYGYMKSVSNPSEQKRSGGSGVYYHVSYLGTPHDYLWLCTTPPVLMYQELKKAYDCGADRYWLLNVGDIKPAELDMQTFFDMAWNFSSFNPGNVNTHQAEFMASWCGDRYEKDFQAILDEYYRLAWIRKPEFMGWEIEWDSPETENLRPTEFSFTNYRDAWKRLDDYRKLAADVVKLEGKLPESKHSAYFEMIGYPVLASEMMNRKFLYAQLNGELAAAGDRQGANYAARLSTEAADSIDTLTAIYNSMENGKWKGMMDLAPAFCAKYQNRPDLTVFKDAGERMINAPKSLEGGLLCHTLDLRKAKLRGNARLFSGIGYDGDLLQLGDAVKDTLSTVSSEAVLPLGTVKGDSVALNIFHLPYFPVYQGKRCRIGVSVDNGEEKVIEYLPVEWSKDWKINILRNSAVSNVTLPLDKGSRKHTLRLRGIDPGMSIQRIVMDEGGLKPGYVGPDLTR